jgi:crossover junction endodeoxyribonuclease RuvC
MTRILGVDPGTAQLGWGVIDTDGHTNLLVEYGVVRTKPKALLPARLHTIYQHLIEILHRLHPDVMAVEEAFLGKNPRSALWIGHARAIALLAAEQHQISLAEYAPREVKLSVVGNGAASKQQVEYMVTAILNTSDRIPTDAADALAVALCHASHTSNHRESFDQ